MAAQKVPTIIVTAEHLLIGEVETRGSRLLEVVTDPHSEFLHLHEAHVSRREAKSKQLVALSEAIVRKTEICLAVLGGGKHESPETRRFAFVDKKSYSAFAIVAGYEVRGRLQLKGASDPVSALTHEIHGFMPLTEATLGHPGDHGEPLLAAVALCNREYISLLHIGGEQ
ncbi:MAG TPA: hypothetical protein VFW87_20435 [Pirellulales bacterium]|nr:hypothetical protein [Pirellulales bacterium]